MWQRRMKSSFLGLAKCVGTFSGMDLLRQSSSRWGGSDVAPWEGCCRPQSTHSCSEYFLVCLERGLFGSNVHIRKVFLGGVVPSCHSLCL